MKKLLFLSVILIALLYMCTGCVGYVHTVSRPYPQYRTVVLARPLPPPPPHKHYGPAYRPPKPPARPPMRPGTPPPGRR